MKRICIWVCFFWLVLLSVAEATPQPPNLLRRQLKNDKTQSYLIHLPQNYDDARKYPLLVILPSTPGRALDQYERWNFYSNREKYIMLCPKFNTGFQNMRNLEDEHLIRMIKEARREFKIDDKRMYFIGFSLGGDFVREFTFKHPKYVAGAAILAANTYESPSENKKAKQIPFYIGVGQDDGNRRDLMHYFARRLQQDGYNMVFRLYPKTKHQLTNVMQEDLMSFLRLFSGTKLEASAKQGVE